MHELSICQALLEQVAQQTRRCGGERVRRIVVEIGPLSGVEPHLLNEAFLLARQGTVAQQADLEVVAIPVTVHCPACDSDHEVAANDLRCPVCGEWQTRLVSGDEMTLRTMDVEMPEQEERERGEVRGVA
ncbi:MAG: hydrogenase maturation nickel metallochaperone HypA [Magnetococcales bacterium]|nr:hydrogenase maturation nickel metallochaperone HypA [Magnetococcales bacterium]